LRIKEQETRLIPHEHDDDDDDDDDNNKKVVFGEVHKLFNFNICYIIDNMNKIWLTR
jgi:hypothetical protein